MKMEFENDWMTLEEIEKLEVKFPVLHTIKKEAYHMLSGLEYKKCMPLYYNNEVIVYPKNEISINLPIAEVRFRYLQKQLDKVNSLVDALEVGDFIRHASCKGSYRWRKIMSINLKMGTTTGQCASHPRDDKLAPYSSENGISTIVEHIKN